MVWLRAILYSAIFVTVFFVAIPGWILGTNGGDEPVGGLSRAAAMLVLAAAVLLLGEAILFASWALVAYAAAFWVAAHLLVLVYEEPTLARRFDDYSAYRASVSRWIPHPARSRT